MLEQKIMDNILKTKIRTKNVIIASWKSKRLLSWSNQIFQPLMNLSYSKVFSIKYSINIIFCEMRVIP